MDSEDAGVCDAARDRETVTIDRRDGDRDDRALILDEGAKAFGDRGLKLGGRGPAAASSPSSGKVMLPSGRTMASAERSGLCQTLILRTSDGPSTNPCFGVWLGRVVDRRSLRSRTSLPDGQTGAECENQRGW